VLVGWLRAGEFGRTCLEVAGGRAIIAMQLVEVDRDEPDVPDRVLHRWALVIMGHRQWAVQAEEALIERARRQGWTTEQTAGVLGAAPVERRTRELVEDRARIRRSTVFTSPPAARAE
jgi:hypothetical protein